MRTLIVLLLALPVASAAPVPKEVKKNPLDAFDGVWWEARFENSVYENPDIARRFTFDMAGGLAIRQNEKAIPEEYTIEIDPSTTPQSFKLKSKGKVIYNAVYAVDADSLRFALTNLTKPLASEVKCGTGDVYYELKRLK